MTIAQKVNARLKTANKNTTFTILMAVGLLGLWLTPSPAPNFLCQLIGAISILAAASGFFGFLLFGETKNSKN